MSSPNHIQITIPKENVDQNQRNVSILPEVGAFNYSQKAKWLHAAILGANDGFVSVASLMMGVGAVRDEFKAVILTFFAGLFASACSMAIGEFITMFELETAQMQRQNRMVEINRLNEENVVEEKLHSSFQVALASFSLGAFVPLLAAAFITDYNVRLVAAVVAAATVALAAFGGIGAALGRARVARSCVRMVIGGWMAMTISFCVTKLLGASGMEM